MARVFFISGWFTISILAISHTAAQADRIQANLPVCADILMARPAENLWPRERSEILIEINTAIASLRAELESLPKHVPPLPPEPRLSDLGPIAIENIVAEVEALAAANERWLTSLANRTPEQIRVHSIHGLVDELENLIRLLAVDQLHTQVEVHRFEGESEIAAYFERLTSGASLAAFEPTLRKVREAAGAPTRAPGKFEAWLRRKISIWRMKVDVRHNVLFPTNGALRITADLARFWTADAKLSDAYVSESEFGFARDFLEAFRASPDLTVLGWNGREAVSTFLDRIRSEIMEKQLNAHLAAMRGIRSLDEAAEYQLLMQLHDSKIDFNWIPGWIEEPGRPRRPVLTVVTRTSRFDQTSGPTTRRPVDAAAPALEPDLGGLVPAR